SRYPEPDYAASSNYKSGGYYNPNKQTNTDLDALITQAASIYDTDKRKELYGKINDYQLGQGLWRPMLSSVSHGATPKKVQSLDTLLTWDGKMSLRNLWIRA